MSLECGHHPINPVCTDSALFLDLQYRRQCFALGSLTSQPVILADTFPLGTPTPPLLVVHCVWVHLTAPGCILLQL